MVTSILKIIITIISPIFIAYLFKYGNKTEIEIREDFAKIHNVKDSYYKNTLRIEIIDDHQYVIFVYGDAGGIAHHAGCPNHSSYY